MTLIKTRRMAAAAALSAFTALLLVGCATTAPNDIPQAPSTPEASRRPNRGGGGVNGLIVALDGKTLQVRGSSGQTSVTYTSKTTFTEQQTADSSAAKAGMCAVVRSTETGSNGTPATQLTAASVSLSQPTGDSCQGGFGGGGNGGGPGGNGGNGRPGGGAPSGTPGGGRPSGGPGGGPSAAPGGGLGVAAVGKIVSVGADQILVSTKSPVSTEATQVTVLLTADTTFTVQAKATASAVKKGKCVAANGATASTGAMTATSIRLSAAVDGECTIGSRRGG